MEAPSVARPDGLEMPEVAGLPATAPPPEANWLSAPVMLAPVVKPVARVRPDPSTATPTSTCSVPSFRVARKAPVLLRLTMEPLPLVTYIVSVGPTAIALGTVMLLLLPGNGDPFSGTPAELRPVTELPLKFVMKALPPESSAMDVGAVTPPAV